MVERSEAPASGTEEVDYGDPAVQERLMYSNPRNRPDTGDLAAIPRGVEARGGHRDDPPAESAPTGYVDPEGMSDEQRRFLEDHGSNLMSSDFYEAQMKQTAGVLLPLIANG